MSAARVETPVPVLVVSCIDPVLREAAVATLLADVPGAVAVRHDLLVDKGLLHRTVYDSAAVIEDEWVWLEHACLSCVLREDVVPVLQRTVTGVRPAAIVLALPVTADALPVVAALSPVPAVRVAAVASVIDAYALEHDLLGDALLVERGLAFTADDRRSVGEALARQVEFADVLLTSGPVSPRTAALLDHLTDPSVGQVVLHEADAAALIRHRRAPGSAFRGDPLHVAASGAQPRHGVWTLDLQSWRPFHPGRLLEHIQTLGSGTLRGRGHFWLPTRPETVGAWDGAGGQLSIGGHGTWTTGPDTHLVITGTDVEPERLLTAFDAVLLDDAELARGLHTWRGRPDGMDPWLGAQRGAA